MIYVEPNTAHGIAWLRAHEATERNAKANADMPRVLLEVEVAQWMLADKQRWADKDFGAKPRELPFRQFLEWRVPVEPTPRPWKNLAFTMDRASEHVRIEAEKCNRLFLAVIKRLALDLEVSWDVNAADRREAQMFFIGEDEHSTQWRTDLAALADAKPSALVEAYHAGRLRKLADDAIGKKRYATRRKNAGRKTIDQLKPGQQMELAL